MIWVYKYDKDYNFIPDGEVYIEEGSEISEGFTEVKPIDGLYKGKFDPDKQEWYESVTQEYINSLPPLHLSHRN
ncbi:hypothetical protein [Bacillus atrophaeus]|uniref:hypothetical protein n=1 Tax=Bacillus atrophaeus TaxID=1452 RepID=UPI00227E92B4|nr:hypothetical protein [Bacillus atrophaeus]MCY8824405.1 hypothetical protein [Bacillus atrophaeus]MCY8842544.1 hypothetical protein [Bacillus atrophaeus]MEC0804754.1 hypothetical protein [Bacillus atrophaeus]MEC0852671.1 hypothetical protein [Bacillus atrophaeus]MEC0859583.1 hypothetical protein [Bacillus atrophaeus]